MRGEMVDHMGVAARDHIGQLRSLYIDAHQSESARALAVVANRIVKICRDTRAEVVDSDDLVALRQADARLERSQ